MAGRLLAGGSPNTFKGRGLPRGVWTSTREAPILIIGAAHVVDLREPLRRVLLSRTLDAVAVELDAERAQAVLRPGESPAPGGGGPVFLRLWGLIQRRLGRELGGGIAGAEMRAAAEVAGERRLPVLLIDDPIRDTLGRLLGSLSLKERVALLGGAIIGLFLPSRLVSRQIDQYNDAPGDYLEEVRQAYPTVARVLLDDRNDHMAERLAEARRNGFGRVAAVVGDAHVRGLATALARRGIPTETVPLARLLTPTGP